MEDKLKQLKFIYEGSVVDFSDGDSMAIGIVKVGIRTALNPFIPPMLARVYGIRTRAINITPMRLAIL